MIYEDISSHWSDDFNPLYNLHTLVFIWKCVTFGADSKQFLLTVILQFVVNNSEMIGGIVTNILHQWHSNWRLVTMRWGYGTRHQANNQFGVKYIQSVNCFLHGRNDRIFRVIKPQLTRGFVQLSIITDTDIFI